MNLYQEAAIANAPKFHIGNPDVSDAYKMALKNLLEINTVSCPAELYNKTGLLDENLGLMIRAGGTYPSPWTRDAAVNTMNGACFLAPEIAKNTLWAVCEKDGGRLCFQQDNQNWDKIVWTFGAWSCFLASGDREFLSAACETVVNSLTLLEETQYNSHYGLFTGGSFFNDGITGYPADLYEPGKESSFVGDHPAVGQVMTLSTNCLYYGAYRILERMAKLLGKQELLEACRRKGDALKDAVNRLLWDEARETYFYLLYPDGRTDPSQEGCGISFAILTEICTREQALKILEHTHRNTWGLVSLWPPFAGISSVEKPLRHNNLIWPFVNGYFITAAAKYGCCDLVGSEILALARMVKKDKGQFHEIYNAETGMPDGGWQVGQHWDSVENQTWSATGYIRAVIFGIFGVAVDENGITFHPCLPEGFGTVSLQGLCIRNITMDIELCGQGSHIEAISVSRRGGGSPEDDLISGEHMVSGETEFRILFCNQGSYQIRIRVGLGETWCD